MKPPVVVLPGITASTLRDEYPPEAEVVWGLLRKDYLRVALHPNDLRYEQIEPAVVRPDRAFSIPYDELVKELRHDLTEQRDEPRPVFFFPYDWRLPLEIVVDQLREFCDEVAARTALLRHYAADGYTAADGRVDLVGHSMGGLLITGYLALHGTVHRARKVVTLGTPFCGSFEAVLKIATGTAELGAGPSRSRERETARITPSLYYLLPENHENEALVVDPGLPDTLFDVELWQRSVIESLAEHIRLNAIDPPEDQSSHAKRDHELMERGRELLEVMLDQAGTFRRSTLDFRLDDVALDADDWMTVVGLGEKTRLRLRVVDRDDGPFFDLRSLDRLNGYPDGEQGAARWDTGDGTVPYWAALPPFLEKNRLIGVADDDFGYWELANRALERWGANLHGMLPAMNRVIKLCAAFLKADAGKKGRAHAGIRGRRAPDLAPDERWNPPIRNLKEERP